MRRRERGTALFVTLIVISLVGIWGGVWIRSLGSLRHDGDVGRLSDAGRDLAESALARGRVALTEGKDVPADAYQGLHGSARVALEGQGPEVTLTATATLAPEGVTEPAVRKVVISLRLKLVGDRWVVIRRSEHALQRAEL